MKGYLINIEQATKENNHFRKVLFSGKHSQLVLMTLLPGEDIGEEVHEVDQFFRIETGTGKAIIDEKEHDVLDGSAIVVPAGAKHNLINTSKDEPLGLYTIYSPPEHRDQTVHATKQDAEQDEDDEFSGTTE